MGNCLYCGKSAGLLKTRHKECEGLFSVQARNAINGVIGLAQFAQAWQILPEERNKLLAQEWEKAVDDFLEDGLLDSQEETRLAEFQNYFKLTTADLNKNGALSRAIQAAILRDVWAGSIPSQAEKHTSLPINLQKGEQVIWTFHNVRYLEDKVKQHYVGSSLGVSFKIVPGVYYRVGQFRGKSMGHTEREHVDTGVFVVTTKHIYFIGGSKNFRIPYGKIVSFLPFSDGIGVIREAANAKPQIFITGDGWFACNLVPNVARL